jgi:hypothetical protein
MAFYTTFDAVFWTGIATMSFAFFGVVIKAMLSSKCDNVNLCCGLIQIHRAVELEEPQIEIAPPKIEPKIQENNIV